MGSEREPTIMDIAVQGERKDQQSDDAASGLDTLARTIAPPLGSVLLMTLPMLPYFLLIVTGVFYAMELVRLMGGIGTPPGWQPNTVLHDSLLWALLLWSGF